MIFWFFWFCLIGLRENSAQSNKNKKIRLRSLAADTSCELDVSWHDGDAFGVNGAQVGVLEEADEVGLRGFLQSKNGRTLETKVSFEVLGDLTDETLEWKFANEKLGGLLIATDFTKGNRTWSVAVWLLDTTGGGGGLACCLCG